MSDILIIGIALLVVIFALYILVKVGLSDV